MYTGMGAYLGQIDPGTVVAIGQAISDAKHFWDDLQAALGIGAGRREADVIVPVQNKLWETVYVPGSAVFQDKVHHTCADLVTTLATVNGASAQFRNYLTTTKWLDGRAAKQALYWLDDGSKDAGLDYSTPYAYMVRQDMQRDITACQTGGGDGTGGGGFNIGGMQISLPMLALGGVALYALTRKRG